ncbi:hypothetical protein LEN26_015849, partial [Aphanomyces euteiches]
MVQIIYETLNARHEERSLVKDYRNVGHNSSCGVNPQDQIIVIESFRLHGEATAQSAAHAAAQRTQEEAALLYEADLLKATAKIAGLEESNRNLASHARRSESPSSGIDDIFIDSRVSRDRPLKLEVSKYGGAADEHLFRWVSEVKLALGAQLVTNETLRVAFALSNLQGRARDWAYNLHMLDDEAFPSFESLVEQLKEQYVHSNVETRFRAKFYQAKQGKGTIQEFVNELRSILGSFENSYRIDEIGRVTVFMYGLNQGPARDELFRLQPQGFNEAINIALNTEHSRGLARLSGKSSDVSTDMEISRMEAASGDERRCFNCEEESELLPTPLARWRLPWAWSWLWPPPGERQIPVGRPAPTGTTLGSDDERSGIPPVRQNLASDTLLCQLGQHTTMLHVEMPVEGFYQILIRACDIPKTAVSTPSGMLWEWLVMPQGLANAPATFNRMVTQKLRPLRDFAPSYFDDIYVHSRADASHTDVEVHFGHLRQVFQTLREAEFRPDPAKVTTITTWPVPATVTELRSWLGLATYLHKFSKNFADIATPLTRLLTKDVQWDWTQECQEAFDGIKASLTQAPILALPDFNRPFSVVCDASVRAIGCCLMQKDNEGRDRPVSYQSRQLRTAERNYPVHDLELLAMKYALVKFRIYLLGSKPFTVYTDHASLRTAVNSPHISDRMARWLAFFAEYNMTVEYKPGRTNVIADALSRRPSEEEPSSLLALSEVRSDLFDRIRGLYSLDPALSRTIDAITAGKSLSTKVVQIGRFTFHDDLLWYTVAPEDAPRVAVPCDPTLRAEIIREFHDTPSGSHFGRDKTYLAVARSFWWPRLYKAVARFVASWGVCQAVKAAPHSQAPLQSLDVPLELWESVSMDFIFGLPSDKSGNTGIFTLVDRASKYLIALPVKASITAEQSARLFFDNVYCHFGLPSSIVSDR